MNRHVLLPAVARACIYVLLAAVLVVIAVDAAVVRAASAVSLQSVTTATNGAGATSLNLPKPSTTIAGDVLVAQIAVRGATTAVTAPVGWHLIRSTASSTAILMATYYKVTSSSEPGSYTWTFSASQPATGGISDFVGVSTSSPIDASSGKVNGNTATASFTQITTTVPNDMLLAFVGVSGNTSVTPPSGFTENYDRMDTSVTTGPSAEVSRKVDTATGSTTVGSAQEATLAVTNVTQLVALKPGTSSPTATPTASPSPTPTPVPINIVAVGDMECETPTCGGVGTVGQVAQLAPSAFFPVGDLVFYGRASDYNNDYNPTFGQFRSTSHPAIGNHDGTTAYYDYWDGIGNQTGRAGPRNEGWYSFSKGSWHFVVLNSNCVSDYMQINCQSGSAEINWLKSDLASHTNLCTIAFMHIPYYTSGLRQYPELQTIFQTLYSGHVDLLIAGHTHYYQRYYPQDANGNRVTNGVTEIVAGTGGGTLANVGSTPTAPNEAVQIGHAFGVLKLVLSQGSYTFRFLPAPGSIGTDSGSGTCH